MGTTTKKPRRPAMTLQDRIWAREEHLLDIRARWYSLQTFTKELHERSGGRRFAVQNEAAWRWMLDARNMLVIDFASWAKSVYVKSGLLGNVRSHHLTELRRDYPPDDHVRPEVQAARRAAFDQLFPNAVGLTPGIIALADSYKKLSQPLLEDRNMNRAHRYEPKKSGSAAAFLDETAFGDLLEETERLLTNLRQSAGLGVVAYDAAHHFSNAGSPAEEMVDAILLGGSPARDVISGASTTLFETTGRWPIEYRLELYRDLHKHTATLPGDELFNDDAHLRTLHEQRSV